MDPARDRSCGEEAIGRDRVNAVDANEHHVFALDSNTTGSSAPQSNSSRDVSSLIVSNTPIKHDTTI